LGLLRWTYPSRFYGRDVIANPAGAEGRAFIGNYQKLGLLQHNTLAVLKPVRQSSTMSYQHATRTMNNRPPDADLLDDAIAYYQTASWLFKHDGQRELSTAEWKRYGKPERPPLALPPKENF